MNEGGKKYNESVSNQWFSFLRSGKRKNALLQQAIADTNKYFETGHIDLAKEEISKLKNKFVRQFGKTNFWGKKSESYALISALESNLISLESIIKETTLSDTFKTAVKSLKEAGVIDNKPNELDDMDKDIKIF